MAEYIVRETGFPGTIKKEIVGELVRCKDCNCCHKAVFAKYMDGEEIERCYCDIHNRYIGDEYYGYCSEGVRKDGEKES